LLKTLDINIVLAPLDSKSSFASAEEVASQLEGLVKEWKRIGALPPMLPWVQHVSPVMVHSDPDKQNRALERIMLSDRDTVIDYSPFYVSSEPENLLSLGSQSGLDPAEFAEHVSMVLYACFDGFV
jgi:hypothetical protein